jgi:conjugative relaxase-like TrwC/TraI family protein
MLTGMILKKGTEGLAAYHCRSENYYFKQTGGIEKELMELTGEHPQRVDPLEYVKVHGGLARTLGYQPGQSITEAELISLLEGRTLAGKKAVQKHKVKGIDLTFSAPKSVSITGLVLDKNPEVIRAHDETILAVMAEVEKHFTVARPNPTQQWSTGKMCYVTVRDGFSREYDPHLHTHVIVMNMTEWQGRTMGLWTRKILQRDFNKAFGELYRCKLAARLTDLGYRVSYIKNGEWRLDKVSRELEQEFSRRHAQIDAKREAGVVDAVAWRETRARKIPGVNKAGILKDWLVRLSRYVVDEAENIKAAIAERLAWARGAEFSVEAAQERDGQRGGDSEARMWQLALRRATERSATTSQQELIYEYLKETMRSERWADITYDNAHARLQKQITQGYIVSVKDRHSERYTSLEFLAAERDYMRYAGVDSAFDYSVESREAARYIKDMNEFNRRCGHKILSAIQGRAVYDILTSKNMINVVQGDAGAGKTTSLKAVAEYYRQQGFDIVGLAIQGVAAKKLADEAGIEAMTLKSYLSKKETAGHKVLIFDEASMLDSRNAARLFKSVHEAGDKLILVGDMNQLESIGAGRVFERYVDYYGRMAGRTKAVKLITMNENYRQRNPVLREVVTMAKQGKMKASLELFGRDGHIFEIENVIERRKAISGLYSRDSLIVVGTAAARDEINDEIRSTLREAGRLRNGRKYNLARADGEGVEHARIVEMAPGDIITFTRNEYRRYDIRNGEKAEVKECGGKFMKVLTEDNRELKINIVEYKDIDYGYALTTYKSQGQTYNRVIVEADTSVPSLVDMRNQYVNITRAREDIRIFTDDTETLKELAEIKTHARDTLDIGVTVDDIVERTASLDRDIQTTRLAVDDKVVGLDGVLELREARDMD